MELLTDKSGDDAKEVEGTVITADEWDNQERAKEAMRRGYEAQQAQQTAYAQLQMQVQMNTQNQLGGVLGEIIGAAAGHWFGGGR